MNWQIGLKQIIQHQCGQVSAEQFAHWQDQYDLNDKELIQILLEISASQAVMPVANFFVGAVAKGRSGDLYLGSSQDIGPGPLHQSIHAEQAAVSVALSHGETQIDVLYINALPCGHCRQFLYELENRQRLLIEVPGEISKRLVDLLPDAYDPSVLGVCGNLLNHGRVTLTYQAKTPLEQAALEAAQGAYSPYYQAYAGVALQLRSGDIMAGSYISNVAHNPSLPPLQAALVNLVAGGFTYQDIERALLFQSAAVVDHVMTTKLTLNTVAPQVSLQEMTVHA